MESGSTTKGNINLTSIIGSKFCLFLFFFFFQKGGLLIIVVRLCMGFRVVSDDATLNA